MEKELVEERHWLTRRRCAKESPFASRFPGRWRSRSVSSCRTSVGGFWGACAGGCSFILPNFVIVASLGALYVYFGGLPPVTAIFYGVSPAVIALILHSCYRLAKLGMEDRVQWLIAAGCLLVTAAVQAEVALLFVVSESPAPFYYGSRGRKDIAAAVSGVLGRSVETRSYGRDTGHSR